MLYQIGGLLILAAFYSVYLGKMFLQKKAGIQTDQMGKGKTGLPKWIEMIMKVSTYLTVLAELVSILGNKSHLSEPWRSIGFGIGLIGAALFIAAVLTMKDSWRAGVSEDKTKLVTSGIFQISRNPAFLGFDLVYLGIVLLFFNLPLWLLSLCSCLMLHLQIVNNEEPKLLEVFGQEYIDYCKKVNRYLGRAK